MSEYWFGVLTPFILIATALLLWLLLGLASRAWLKLHRAFSKTITVDRNLAEFSWVIDEEGSPKPEYWDSANMVRDRLLTNPKLRVFAGFGRLLFVIRETRMVSVESREWAAAADTEALTRLTRMAESRG